MRLHNRSMSRSEPSTHNEGSRDVAFDSERPGFVPLHMAENILLFVLATQADFHCMHVDKLLHTARVEGREWGQGVGVLLSSGYCISDLGGGNSYRAHYGLVPDFA